MSEVSNCSAGEEICNGICIPTYDSLERNIRELENEVSSYVTDLVNLSDEITEKNTHIEHLKYENKRLIEMLEFCQSGLKWMN